MDDGNNRFYCQVWNGSGTAKNTVSTTKTVPYTWQHITCVYNQSYIKIYINGALEGTPTRIENNAIRTNSTLYGLGGRSLAGQGNVYNGTLDEMKIWNRTLTDQEILNNYNETYSTIGNYINNISLWGNIPQNFT